MNKKEFQKKKFEGRDLLLKKIVQTFADMNPVAIHQFGSGPKGFKDEFSDIDIWITFRDEDIDRILKKLSNTFTNIAPILVKHHSKTWSPVGGSSNSIIHETDFGLFVVDYYISRLSETMLKSDSAVLYGDDSIKKGEWKLNRHVDEKMKDTHTFRKDIDLFLDLIFISYKGIIRKWEDDSFIKTLKLVYKGFRKKYEGKLKQRLISLSFKSNYKLLSDLHRISNKRQKRAINKIRKYAHQVEDLYEK